MTVSRSMKRVIGASALPLALLGLVAFAHTPAGRPLLAALSGAAGCPVSLDAGDPARIEAFRLQQLARRRGVLPEASHAALIFELGTTRKPEVLAWSQRVGAQCRATRSGSVLRCSDVPAQALGQALPAPRIDDLHLQFDPSDRLVAVDLFRVGASGSAALAWVDALDRELERRVGKATSEQGEHSGAYLSQRSLNRVARQYSYRNYVAEVSAMNFGTRGVRVREQYQWLAPGGV
jgi:hypothetical protein